MIDEALAGRYGDASEDACQWRAVADAAYGGRRTVMTRRAPVAAPGAPRCGLCRRAGGRLDTVVVDRQRSARPVLACDGCVELADWRDFLFDPTGNVYTRI